MANRHDLREDEAELVRLIAELGTASEVELQAKILKSLKTLREELKDLISTVS